ncbi:hypothetical protein M8475_003578, partial [Vibrio parahaemolyticus]|nr:hypothetical protein [Vibrio parahaemolyticus]
AEAVCATQDKDLPGESELKALYNQYPDKSIFKQKNWPINLPYWTNDGSAIDLGSGTSVPAANSSEYLYVTCTTEDEVVTVDVYQKTELESGILPGVKQEPKLIITYRNGSTKIVNAETISVRDTNVATIENNSVIARYYGDTTIDMTWRDVEVYYTLSVLDAKIRISGASLVSVGETRNLSVSYEDQKGDIIYIDDVDITSIESNDSDIAKITKNKDHYVVTGIEAGSTDIIAKIKLNDIPHDASANILVISTDWCWKRGRSKLKNSSVCVGLSKEVMQAKEFRDLVDHFGSSSNNIYITPDNLKRFCSTFNSEPFEILKENVEKEIITIDNYGVLEEIGTVTTWVVSMDERVSASVVNEDHSYYSKAVKFSHSDGSHKTGVPLCTDRDEHIQARMLLD